MVLTKVGVTGASGMVGRHLLRVLAARGVSVVATSRRPPQGLPQGITWFPGELTALGGDELGAMFAGVNALVHLAAAIPGAGAPMSREEVFAVNTVATLRVGEAALKLGVPLIYVSSATVYAEPESIGIREDDPTLAAELGSWYAQSKLMGEHLLRHLSGIGLKLCIIRPSSLYGYGLPADKLIPRWLTIAAGGGVIELAPPVDDRVDLIHAADLVQALVAACEHEARGIYNVASGEPRSMLEIARACVRVAGRGKVRVVEGFSRPISTRFALDCERARAGFGFLPQLSLDDGLRRTLEDGESACDRR